MTDSDNGKLPRKNISPDATPSRPIQGDRGPSCAGDVKIHEIREWPEFFSELYSGNRTFTYVRNDDDRDFRTKDMLIVTEWTPKCVFPECESEYTGRKLIFNIGYTLQIDDENIILSLLEFRGR